MHFVWRATSDDLPAIAQLDEWKQAKESVVLAGECYLASETTGGMPRAYAILNHSFFHRAWIAILFVRADHRRCGFGDALMQHMEQACGEKRIWTSTELPN